MSIVAAVRDHLRLPLHDLQGFVRLLWNLSPLRCLGLLITLFGAQPSLGQSLEGAPNEGWVRWQVPKQPGTGQVCCFEGADPRERGCSLDARGKGYHVHASAAQSSASDRLDVYVRFAAGEPVDLRAYDGACPVHSALPPTELAPIGADDSARWLAAQSVDQQRSRGSAPALAESAVTALALHATPVATAALIDLSAADKPEALRRSAAFWLGQARGEAGIERVLVLSRGAEADAFIEHLAFVLSQSELPQARAGLSALTGAGRSDAVRGSALFWIAQAGWQDAEQRILDTLDVDATSGLQEKAVFALSQLEEGADEALIRLLQGRYPRAAKKHALFWLGQSGSDRALEFLDRYLREDAG
jgi:hypothetical protein